jgi:hypothetical protein
MVRAHGRRAGISSVDDIESNSVSTDILGRGNGDLVAANSTWFSQFATPNNSPSDVSATSYTEIAQLTGVLSSDRAPDGTTLYGRFFTRGKITGASSGDELRARPELHIPGSERVTLTELQVSTTSDSNVALDSGWTEITTALSNVTYLAERIMAEVDAGTGAFTDVNEHYLAFDWRVD